MHSQLDWNEEMPPLSFNWGDLKAYELRALAERDTTVVLPVASVEQHGPVSSMLFTHRPRVSRTAAAAAAAAFARQCSYRVAEPEAPACDGRLW